MHVWALWLSCETPASITVPLRKSSSYFLSLSSSLPLSLSPFSELSLPLLIFLARMVSPNEGCDVACRVGCVRRPETNKCVETSHSAKDASTKRETSRSLSDVRLMESR